MNKWFSFTLSLVLSHNCSVDMKARKGSKTTINFRLIYLNDNLPVLGLLYVVEDILHQQTECELGSRHVGESGLVRQRVTLSTNTFRRTRQHVPNLHHKHTTSTNKKSIKYWSICKTVKYWFSENFTCYTAVYLGSSKKRIIRVC